MEHVQDMEKFIPEKLKTLSAVLPAPLYVVGGSVRDFLAGHARAEGDFSDWDVCAPVLPETFAAAAEQCGFLVHSVYKNTGTVKLTDPSGTGVEFSPFRSDEYVRGTHTPAAVWFTQDIVLDAKRRDFTCNAVYYDIKNHSFVDPLGGMSDIAAKRMRTVRESGRVFGEDGLRLLRLARQCGQLGFTPDEETLCGARQNAALIRDIVPERIFAELKLMLCADEKYGVGDGHYRALRVLDQTRVLDEILPELAAGRGMEQPAAFHAYDVLEHSLRCVLYAPASVRFAALLHDAGKPFCKHRDGNFYLHPEEGATLSDAILFRLKAPVKLKAQTRELVLWHMYDMLCDVREKKLRRFFAEHASLLDELISLKQADYSACKNDLSPAPTVARWRELLTRMRAENAPFSLRDLRVTGKELLQAGLPAPYAGKVLHALLLHCAAAPQDNRADRLIRIAFGAYNDLKAAEKAKGGGESESRAQGKTDDGGTQKNG